MQKVFKYSVDTTELPIGFKILHGDIQNGEFFIWVEIDNKEQNFELFDCQVYGTGHNIESKTYTYLNTVMEDQFVWHFYWRIFTKKGVR